METLFLTLLLAAVLAFFAAAVRDRAQSLLHRRPGAVWAAPPLLTGMWHRHSCLCGFQKPHRQECLCHLTHPRLARSPSL